MVLVVLEEEMLKAAVSDKGDARNAETREHGAEVCRFGENGVLAPCLAAGPGIVVGRNALLKFDVAAAGLHVWVDQQKRREWLSAEVVFFAPPHNDGTGWRRHRIIEPPPSHVVG